MSGLNNHKAEILQTWGEPRVISAVYLCCISESHFAFSEMNSLKIKGNMQMPTYK